ncbi:MAG TPA: VOC family protein [Burkholderiales bacterium]|nr:VOC family protein [Burkholderiales bacterium]
MSDDFPRAVPEIPVTDMATALAYYETKLDFNVDWGRDGGGIAGISQGRSRLFLTDEEFRGYFHNQAPVVIWLNLDSKEEVDALHEKWKKNGAGILHPPESKPWSRLHEFVVADADGNVIRAFYNY